MRGIRSVVKQVWNQHKLVRFLVVGSFNTLLDIITLNILFGVLGLPVLVANTISVSIGITISYFLNHRVVFRHPQKYSLKTYSHFFLVTGLSVLAVQNTVLYLTSKVDAVSPRTMVHVLSINISANTLKLNVGKALAVILGAVWNFFLYKSIVFRHQKDVELEDETLIV